MKKYLERVTMWQDMPLGLHWHARVYNTFALSVLGYIAQLEEPPPWVLATVESSLSKAAKGPGMWAIPQDLWSLKESFGQSASFKKLDTYALAAKVRVLTFDRACQPPDAFSTLYEQIESVCREGNNVQNVGRWYTWYNNTFIRCLFKSKAALHDLVGSAEQIRIASQMQATEPNEDKTWKKRCQAEIYKAVRAQELEAPWHRIDHKLQRWRLLDPGRHGCIPGSIRQRSPGWQSQRAWWLLQSLSNVAPPRVQSAAFSTIWNRWTTSARFQSNNVLPCLLGCGVQEGDRIEHYCKCGVVKNVCAKLLRLDPRVFANLHAFTLTSPLIMQRSELACLGLLIYATYRTVNSIRHRYSATPVMVNLAYDALCQAVREGAKGHSFALRVLRTRWVADVDGAAPPDDNIPAKPLLPFDGVLKRYRELGAVTRNAKRRRSQ